MNRPLDFQRTDDVIHMLDVLSPVFALILRNALHFEAQEEKVVAQAEVPGPAPDEPRRLPHGERPGRPARRQ